MGLPAYAIYEDIDRVEIKRLISERRSTVATLADIVEIHKRLHEESRQRFNQLGERFDRFLEQAHQDRALMRHHFLVCPSF